jgi:lipid-binding SYLF domain-containing protein
MLSMQKVLLLGAVVLVLMTTGVRGDDGDLDKAIDKAVEILDKYASEKDDTAPAEAFQKAKGLAILNVMKAGFIFSGSGGTGLVTVKMKNGKWSPPSAISAGGFGVGLQAGGSNIDYVILMNSEEAVEQFSKEGNYRGGVEAEGTAGTEGRNMSAGMAGMSAPVTSYSFSEGLFGGVSTSSLAFGVEDDTNESFYGQKMESKDILAGKVKNVPASVQKLWRALEEADRKTKVTYQNAQKDQAKKK